MSDFHGLKYKNDGIVRVFRGNGTRFLGKNTKNLSSDKSLMFWGAIRSDGRKLLVKCPNKLNAVGYLEILKIYEKVYFLDIFQDNAPVHKSMIIGNFVQEKATYSADLNSIKIYWRF